MNNIIIYSNLNNNLNFEDYDKIFKFENKLNKIKNKILEYDTYDINSIEDLHYNLAKLVIFKELHDYILSNDEIGKKYFGDYWKSYQSNLNDLIMQRNSLIRFNQLIDSGLFSDETINNLEENQYPVGVLSAYDLSNQLIF